MFESVENFTSIINYVLPLFYYGYNSPIYDWCESEYNIFTKDILKALIVRAI